MQKVRLRFEKTGATRFISHLDMLRTMCRAIKRANLPVRFTEGFNPKPKITFSNPLSLGYESLDEVCDFELTDDSLSLDSALASLAATMPGGLTPKRLYIRESKISDSAYAAYTIYVKTADFDADSVKELFARDRLVVLKRSKSGERETDILPLIKSIDVKSVAGGVEIDTVVECGTAATLNPDSITKAIGKYISENFDARFVKTATLGADGNPFV